MTSKECLISQNILKDLEYLTDGEYCIKLKHPGSIYVQEQIVVQNYFTIKYLPCKIMH